MSQCVPSWDIDDPPNLTTPSLVHHSPAPQVPIKSGDHNNEVAVELTWQNGNISTHGFGRNNILPIHPVISSPWQIQNQKPQQSATIPGNNNGGNDTLESVVNLAAWLNKGNGGAASVDALVPCGPPRAAAAEEVVTVGVMASSTANGGGRKRARVEASQGSGWTARAATQTLDITCDDGGFTTTEGSPTSVRDRDDRSPETENTSFGGGGEHESVAHSRRSLSQRDLVGDEDEKVSKRETGKSTVSTRRSRASAIHNQSERKRRDRINEKMRTLQKLVPNSSKTDKASMLDEVIEYLKQLQAQVRMMSRMGTMPPTPMMIPAAMNMQQQMAAQMTMMAQMAQIAQMTQLGMGGMGMVDFSSAALGRAPPAAAGPAAGMPSLIPAVIPPFLPIAAAAASQRDPAAAADPFSTLLTCPNPTQPMGMDAYNRMAALYQQLYQQNHGINPTS